VPQSIISSLGLPSWFNINFISLMTAWGSSEVGCVGSVRGGGGGLAQGGEVGMAVQGWESKGGSHVCFSIGHHQHGVEYQLHQPHDSLGQQRGRNV
jgi:hypothetical protein